MAALEVLVSEATGNSVHHLRLIFAGKKLEAGFSLRSYKIDPLSTIHMVARLGFGSKCVAFADVSNAGELYSIIDLYILAVIQLAVIHTPTVTVCCTSLILHMSAAVHSSHESNPACSQPECHHCHHQGSSTALIVSEQPYIALCPVETINKLEFSTKGPVWQYCNTGLNVEGICTRTDCEANGKIFINHKVRWKVQA